MTSAPFSRVAAAAIRVGLLLLVLAAPSSHAAEPKRILMLHSFGHNTSPYDSVASQFRKEMLDAWPGHERTNGHHTRGVRPLSELP